MTGDQFMGTVRVGLPPGPGYAVVVAHADATVIAVEDLEIEESEQLAHRAAQVLTELCARVAAAGWLLDNNWEEAG